MIVIEESVVVDNDQRQTAKTDRLRGRLMLASSLLLPSTLFYEQ